MNFKLWFPFRGMLMTFENFHHLMSLMNLILCLHYLILCLHHLIFCLHFLLICLFLQLSFSSLFFSSSLYLLAILILIFYNLHQWYLNLLLFRTKQRCFLHLFHLKFIKCIHLNHPRQITKILCQVLLSFLYLFLFLFVFSIFYFIWIF